MESAINCLETCLWKQYVQEEGWLLLASTSLPQCTPTPPSLFNTALPCLPHLPELTCFLEAIKARGPAGTHVFPISLCDLIFFLFID